MNDAGSRDQQLVAPGGQDGDGRDPPREDKSLVRTGNALRVMASLRSLAISLVRIDGRSNIAAANRHHACDPQRTLKPLQTA